MNSNVFGLFPTIETERLILREIKEDDANTLFQFNSDPDCIRFVPRDPYKNIKEAENRIKNFIKGFEDNTNIWWAFELKSTGTLIGYGGLFELNAKDSNGEIGYGIIKEYWGQRYTSEAIEQIVHFGINTLQLHRIYGHITQGNTASEKILTKLGFKHEGTHIDDIFARGQYFSTGVFARVNTFHISSKNPES